MVVVVKRLVEEHDRCVCVCFFSGSFSGKALRRSSQQVMLECFLSQE